MKNEIEKRLATAPVVPLIQAQDTDVAVATAEALAAGGLTIIEVVLRTEEAMNCLQAIADSADGVIAGAGTVLNKEQATAVVDAGAKFIVSPGLDDGVVDVAMSEDLPVFPGIATASELQRAWNLGLRTVKFFPARQAGGIAMLKALGSVFRDVRFMPTGGVSAGNLGDYLQLPFVLACGGSWLTPAAAIDAGDFFAITRLAEEAVSLSRSVRG